MVISGKEFGAYGSYDLVDRLDISPNASIWVMRARKGKNYYLVINGKNGAVMTRLESWPFSPMAPAGV